MNRYTPAVTRVEEWTREETGVGAAIAAGSQTEKGSWALFEKLLKIKNKHTYPTFSILLNKKKGQREQILNIKHLSPRRFTRMVNLDLYKL